VDGTLCNGGCSASSKQCTTAPKAVLSALLGTVVSWNLFMNCPKINTSGGLVQLMYEIGICFGICRCIL
jgi:hypothetical protein